MSNTSIIFLVFALLLLCLQNGVEAHRDDVSEDSLHYALHAVHPHFKDGVFTSNQQAMEVLEREDRLLALKVYALAKRQSNSTVTTSKAAPPAESSTPIESPKNPTQTSPKNPAQTLTTPVATPNTPAETPTPFLTTSTSSFETVITSPNGQRSTRTTFTVVVATVTPTGQTGSSSTEQTAAGNPSLQSFGVRAREFPTGMMVLLLCTNIVLGYLWINL